MYGKGAAWTATLALIHSPLVGPATWAPAAEELRRDGAEVVVPDLDAGEEGDEPFWRQQRALGLGGEQRAGLDGPDVEQHGAGAALAGVAADVGAGQAELVPQDVDDDVPFDLDAPRLDVDLDDRGVGAAASARSATRAWPCRQRTKARWSAPGSGTSAT